MAKCTCTGSTGSTYATVNRGYGCLSSVPTASGIPYNCFLPPTNMSYYQNYPFYNGPCGTVAGSNGGSGSSATSQPSAPNGCCCCPVAPSGGSGSSVPSTPLQPAIPGGCFPWYYPFCCPTTSEDEEEEEEEDMNANPYCCFPWFCNPCAGSAPGAPLMPPACKPCKPNVCCQPAALIATSSGAVTPTASGTVQLNLANTISNALSVMGDTITFNCPGTYLVTLTSNIPGTANYTGTVSLALNGTTLGTTTQSITSSQAAHDTTQAIVKASKGSTLTITTSASSTAITPASGTNLFTVSVVRIA